jgi:hypothetical protein
MTNTPSTVHLVLQGKGGVGKSFVAALLGQYYLHHTSVPPICVDTDPVNATFAGYRAFGTRRLELLDRGIVNTGRFDALMLSILAEDATFIVDNGASCFLPFTQYLFEGGVLEVLRNAGRRVVVHTVLTGGNGLHDTLAGFAWLAKNMPTDIGIACWLNEFFGVIEAEGKTFEAMKVYREHKDRVSALLRLPRQNAHTFGEDLKLMLDNRLTFLEAKESPLFNVLAKQRLAMMERQLLSQLQLVA